MANNGKALVTVTAATGHIGRVASELLLKKGFRVRAVGRDAGRLEPLKKLGAEPFTGDVLDADAMAKAFEGASSVFLLVPPSMTVPDLRAYQNKVSEAFEKAAKKAKTPSLVLLSSIGAHLENGTGPIAGLHDAENRFVASGIPTRRLRPVYFMENHMYGLALIKGMGFYGTPLAGEAPIPQIATTDIGAFAAEKLAAAPGKEVVELFGPREYSMLESTKLLAAAAGKPDLKYVQFPYEDARKAMLGMGMSPGVAGAFVEMYRAFNEGKVSATQTPTRCKTTLEDWAKTVFKPAFESAAVAAH